MIEVTEKHLKIRDAFAAEGFNLWFVGGCVRDSLLGITPKDIDLCTDANPEEQIEVYKKHKLFYIPTGVKHGTITVKLKKDLFEITSLRTESEHDGRHAVCAYTRDLTEDLSRRDLTINAMALDFYENVIDPFGGSQDLIDKKVRFVGKAEERMKEDYLRILRFFRFHARFTPFEYLDHEAVEAIKVCGDGLKQISAERIWQEMQKIIVTPGSMETLRDMRDLGIFTAIKLPVNNISDFGRCDLIGLRNASMVLGFYLSTAQIYNLSNDWRLSKLQTQRALYIARNKDKDSIDQFKEMLVDGGDRRSVFTIMNYHGIQTDDIEEWDVPVFPVRGADLIESGVQPSQSMGQILNDLKEMWKVSDYKVSKDDLLRFATMETVKQN